MDVALPAEPPQAMSSPVFTFDISNTCSAAGTAVEGIDRVGRSGADLLHALSILHNEAEALQCAAKAWAVQQSPCAADAASLLSAEVKNLQEILEPTFEEAFKSGGSEELLF